MSGFIRPEAAERLWRWRDVIAGIAFVAMGVSFAAITVGLRAQIGIVLALIGAALIWTGFHRLRRPVLKGGPGLVEVDERQVTYFGPNAGGTISIDALSHIDVRSDGGDGRGYVWIFHQPGQEPLHVPGDAEGVDAIFDALSALSDVDVEAVIAMSGSDRAAQSRVWTRERKGLH